MATPLGNMADAPPRLKETLQTISILACEDTRRAGKLCLLLGVKTPKLIRLNKDNEAEATAKLLALLQEGHSIGLVSDGGLPAVSDPGARLVSAARGQGVAVTVIPGPSAPGLAVAGSGFAGPYVFAGFLPRKGKDRTQALSRLGQYPETIVLFEAPTRIIETLADLEKAWGNRPAWLARELTKLHEEWLGPTLADIHATLSSRPEVLGEITLVVQGCTTPQEAAQKDEIPWQQAALTAVEKGQPLKEAAAQVAKHHGLPRREVYQFLLTQGTAKIHQK